MVRVKFKVQRIERTLWSQNKEMQTIVLLPVVSGSEENEQFFATTPTGEMKFGTMNAEIAAMFELGGEYYIDLISATG